MFSYKRNLLIKAGKVVDIFTLLFCLGFSIQIHSDTYFSLASFLLVQIQIKHLFLLGILALFWHFILSFTGLYQSKRMSNNYQEYVDILKCCSLESLFLLVIGLVFKVTFLNTIYIFTFWLNINLLMLVGRIVLRFTLALVRKMGKNQRRILIVGTGNRALKFADMVIQMKEMGYLFIGFVDDKWAGKKKSTSHGAYLGDFQDFPNILRDYVVDEVTISLPIKSYYGKIEKIISLCEEQGIIVRLLTDMFTVSLAKSRLSTVGNIPVLTLHSAPYEDPQIILKRVFDIIFSASLLTLLVPLFMFASILIKLTSKGPVLFFQKRIGYNKRIFNIIKFRTMVENAEEILPSLEILNEADGPNFKLKKDPRMTMLGKILRRASIDELPQLINVFLGDMSLVGPRPLPVRDYQGFDANWHKRRFSMVPGITCLWQINGRNNIDFSKWMELDMEYIDKWSLWFDIKILFKTIPVIITGKGAM